MAGGLLLAPNPMDDTTSGVPWSPSYTGPRTTTRVTGPGALPTNNVGQQQADDDAARWDTYVKYLRDLLQQSAGMDRWKVSQQLADAEKGRQNAYRIAQLQADTSRYGTDAQKEVQLKNLLENQRQFDANHGLEMQRFGLEQQKLGLDVAKAYTQYASTPDLTFQRRDLMEGLNRANAGLGPTPYGSSGTPQAHTWEDFAALSGFGGVPAVQAGTTAGGAGANAPGMPSAAAAAAGGTGTDARMKAIRAVADAIPPSDGTGHDDDDFAALSAIQNIYRTSRPGTYQRLRPGQQAAFRSGLARLGYDPQDSLADMQRNAPGQTAARSA